MGPPIRVGRIALGLEFDEQGFAGRRNLVCSRAFVPATSNPPVRDQALNLPQIERIFFHLVLYSRYRKRSFLRATTGTPLTAPPPSQLIPA